MTKLKFDDFVEFMKSNDGYEVKETKDGAITHYQLNAINDDKGNLVLYYEVPEVGISRKEIEFDYYAAFIHLVTQQRQGNDDIIVEGLLNLTYLVRKIASSVLLPDLV